MSAPSCPHPSAWTRRPSAPTTLLPSARPHPDYYSRGYDRRRGSSHWTPASLSPDASSRKRAERASDKRSASPSPDESLGYWQQSLLPRKPASPSLDASPAVSLPAASQPASPTTSTCATAPTPSWEGSSTRRADHRRQVPPPLYSSNKGQMSVRGQRASPGSRGSRTASSFER